MAGMAAADSGGHLVRLRDPFRVRRLPSALIVLDVEEGIHTARAI